MKASKLIESFLIGLPVPGVFLYKPRTGSGYQVIDGHQRITSVVSYLKGTIGERKFRLKGVNERWNGKSFDELGDDERFKLEQAVMRATIIQQLDPQDNRSIYMIFERLNTGGMNLNPMEVRRCVYHGPLIEALDKMNALKNWRKCLAKDKTDRRFRDVEVVLRVLALWHRWESYEKPMKGFLSDFLADNKDKDGVGWLSEFDRACGEVLSVYPNRPFHLRGKLNYGALDAVMVAMLNTDSIPNEASFKALFEDNDFAASTSANTSDRSEVHNRIQKAIEYLS